MTIKLKLKEILQQQKISQRELARRTGLRTAAINDLANNRRNFVYLYHLDTIARKLDMDPRDLIEYDPKEPHERPISYLERQERNVGNNYASSGS